MKKNFYRCKKCGKNLIERKKNGVWRFIFGRSARHSEPPVQMEIYGHVKMKCIRDSCKRQNPDHWNIFNLLPNPIDEVEKDPASQAKQQKQGEQK